MLYAGTYAMTEKLRAIGTALVIAAIFSIAYSYWVIEIQLSLDNNHPIKIGESPPLISINFWQSYVLDGITFLGIGITMFAAIIFRSLETKDKSRTQ